MSARAWDRRRRNTRARAAARRVPQWLKDFLPSLDVYSWGPEPVAGVWLDEVWRPGRPDDATAAFLDAWNRAGALAGALAALPYVRHPSPMAELYPEFYCGPGWVNGHEAPHEMDLDWYSWGARRPATRKAAEPKP